MCLGLPMTIIETDGISALCEFRGKQRRVSMLLLSGPSLHSKVLVHVDTAIRFLDDEEAQLIGNAIEGISAALNGEDCERFFADLIDCEPTLPEHLWLDECLWSPSTSHDKPRDKHR
ncbi:HypC/HybG/HupF family hydrogenase formation chaperone [Bradyrhizobium sp. DASA03120]|uniref:HypC/HybG/HupF family hydrogenase formation chaperone n=1 Tax=Bradyrhizobium sp. SMVTL-02 TaxID=3395917 RepID=UPI003F7226E4